ncbi:MAG: hypothetical protein JHC74_14595 [Thermoleophilia bacterium]|nr:hypothetical protein [Thermoleophilia bacterium]
MTARTRIAAFVVVLGASFGAGALAGAAVDPLRQEEPAHPHVSPAPAAPRAGTTTAPGQVHDDHGGHAP